MCDSSVGQRQLLPEVLTGPLSRSTVNHLVHRELQPSICAVSQLECCGGNAGCAALMQSLSIALAALAASPFLIGGM